MEEQPAASILSLRDKPKTLEELRGDDIVDTMDFLRNFLVDTKKNIKTIKKQ